jgi:Leucine-rich repeat (LRR) protein
MPNISQTLAHYFRHILLLDVSHNFITRLEALGLVRACPFLERFNFSHNLVADIAEIMPLGKLRHLIDLDFRDNPVSESSQNIEKAKAEVMKSKNMIGEHSKAKFPSLIRLN